MKVCFRWIRIFWMTGVALSFALSLQAAEGNTFIPLPNDSGEILGSRRGGTFDPVLTPRVGSLEGKTGDEKTALDRQPKVSRIIGKGYIPCQIINEGFASKMTVTGVIVYRDKKEQDIELTIPEKGTPVEPINIERKPIHQINLLFQNYHEKVDNLEETFLAEVVFKPVIGILENIIFTFVENKSKASDQFGIESKPTYYLPPKFSNHGDEKISS